MKRKSSKSKPRRSPSKRSAQARKAISRRTSRRPARKIVVKKTPKIQIPRTPWFTSLMRDLPVPTHSLVPRDVFMLKMR